MCVSTAIDRLAERAVQHDVGRLAADAGQRLERLACSRHVAAVLAHQDLGQRDDVLRLVAEEADGADVRREALDAELRDRRRRVGVGKESRGRLVHALVGRLRRQHDGDQQLERRRVLELGLRIGIGLAKALEDRAALGRVHGGLPSRESRPGASGAPLVHSGIVLEQRVRLGGPASSPHPCRPARTRSRPAPRRRSRPARRPLRSRPTSASWIFFASSSLPVARRPRATVHFATRIVAVVAGRFAQRQRLLPVRRARSSDRRARSTSSRCCCGATRPSRAHARRSTPTAAASAFRFQSSCSSAGAAMPSMCSASTR